jgi:type II secretory pathway pseudopilin PulG
MLLIMKKGITLIETVVAVTVLTLALGGPFLLAAQSLRSAAYAKEEVTAARLAEEGLEIVHSLRDNESGDGRAWNTLVTSCATGCVVDVTARGAGAAASIWTASTFVPCGGGCSFTNETTRVYQHSSSLLYTQNKTADATWKATSMRRMVQVIPVNANNEYKVVSEVRFMAGPRERSVVLHDTIMHWFPTFSEISGS